MYYYMYVVARSKYEYYSCTVGLDGTHHGVRVRKIWEQQDHFISKVLYMDLDRSTGTGSAWLRNSIL